MMPIPYTLLIPLILLQVILIAVALVDLIPRDPERVNGPKWAWALAVLLITGIGPIAYLVIGRKE